MEVKHSNAGLKTMNADISLNKNEDLNDVFAVIVLYKTVLQNSDSFNSLLKTAKHAEGVLEILLYNNYPQLKLDSDQYKNQHINITEINDDANSGVSKAYNIANSIAKNKNRIWLLLLDQDTQLPENFFPVFFAERNKDVYNNKLYIPIIKAADKIISPANYFLYRGFIKNKIDAGREPVKNLSVINSGVIINTILFDEAGGFNEEVKLDFSDVSFFRRLRKIYSTVFILNVTCRHSFSGLEYDDYEKNLSRFKIYNDNAKAFAKEKGVIKPLLFLQVFIRAMHLSLKFKTTSFLRSIKFT